MKRSRAFLEGTLVISAPLWTGSAQAAVVSPSSQDYGSQAVGATTGPVTFSLATSSTNCSLPHGTGGCTLWNQYATDTTALGGNPGTTVRSDDFAISNVSCSYPSMVSPYGYNGASFCSFEASFAPAAGGARSTTLNFPENPGTSASLTLTGTGLASAAAPKKCRKRHHHRKHCRKKH